MARGLRRHVPAHDRQKPKIHVAHGHDIVHAVVRGGPVLHKARLGRAGRDEHGADLIRAQLGMLAQRLRLGQPARDLDRRQDRHDVVAQVWKAQANEPHNGRAGRVDDGPRNIHAAHIVARILGHQLRRLRHLEHLVKADVEQTLQHIVHIVEMVKLTVQRRRGQGDAPFLLLGNILHPVEIRLFCLVRADTDALAAIDTQFGIDDGVTITNAYRLRRAPLQTVGATLASVDIQRNRMLILHSELLI